MGWRGGILLASLMTQFMQQEEEYIELLRLLPGRRKHPRGRAASLLSPKQVGSQRVGILLAGWLAG